MRETGVTVFEYEGSMTVRPMGRGIIIEETVSSWEDLEQVVISLLGQRYTCATGWTGRARVRIELEPDHD